MKIKIACVNQADLKIEEVMPFKCESCDIWMNIPLGNIFTIHRGCKDFRCETCGKDFSHNSFMFLPEK